MEGNSRLHNDNNNLSFFTTMLIKVSPRQSSIVDTAKVGEARKQRFLRDAQKVTLQCSGPKTTGTVPTEFRVDNANCNTLIKNFTGLYNIH